MNSNNISGGIFTGIILLFIGLGMLLGQTGAFVLIGIGAAFIITALFKWLGGRKKEN